MRMAEICGVRILPNAKRSEGHYDGHQQARAAVLTVSETRKPVAASEWARRAESKHVYVCVCAGKI
jgi:hypothetical protein